MERLNVAVEEHVARTASDPRDVAKVVATALEAEHPRFRYTAGLTAKMGHFMRGKVPTSIVRKVVGRHFGLRQVNWHQGSAAITLGRRPFFALRGANSVPTRARLKMRWAQARSSAVRQCSRSNSRTGRGHRRREGGASPKFPRWLSPPTLPTDR